MPKPRRESAARADTRPAFNRPPGAGAAPRPAFAAPSQDDEPQTPTPKRRPRDKPKSSPLPSPSPHTKHRRAADRDQGGGVSKNARRDRDRDRPAESPRDRAKYSSGTSTNSGTGLLSSNALAKLNAYNEKLDVREKREARKPQAKQYKNLKDAEPARRRTARKKNRNVSGAVLEEGRAGKRAHRSRRHRNLDGDDDDDEIHRRSAQKGRMPRKKVLWLAGLLLVLLIIFIAVAVAVSKNHKKSGATGATGSSSAPTSHPSSTPSDCDSSSIPPEAKGTYTDVSTWKDTADFNCTYTNDTVGGLSVMGLYSAWDDSVKANDQVPALNEQWDYGKRPIRGVNLGGWLSIEPFITPSLFQYPTSAGVVDEYTLCQKLGSAATRIIEAHYASFITKQDFDDIRQAGLDHVRIPFPYWAVTTYEGDPYVARVAWRYLLRAIEYARKNGLRVNLDLHAVPGSQNGWTHSGRLGAINWIIGPDGATNAQRSLDIHHQLSQFFAQDRYKNVVTIYGLVNEPKMLVIPPDAVTKWNQQAVSVIRGNGIQQYLVFGDGFLGLDTWTGVFQGVDDKLVMDTHQYQIFNTGQLKMKHADKINLACSGWTGLMVASNNRQTGWGPTLDGEWSQADTDCAPYLNNVGVGSRWAGTLNTGDPETAVLTPTCADPPCSCGPANADPSTYSASYKQFLRMYAEAQIHSFEQAWGWFYWTWKTENAVQWSWKLGLAAGILPQKAYAPSFRCDANVPDFGDLPDGY